MLRNKSIIQKDMSKCFICGRPKNAIHEIFYGVNRQKSIRYGCYVSLCNEHHNMSNYGVHLNRKLDLKLKRIAQSKFEETHSREEFIKEFGKSWLD